MAKNQFPAPSTVLLTVISVMPGVLNDTPVPVVVWVSPRLSWTVKLVPAQTPPGKLMTTHEAG